MKKEFILEIIIMQLPAVIIFVWWAANERNKIYIAVDDVKDLLEKLYTQLDKRVDLHIQDSHHARENLLEKINGQGRRFGAKFERIERYIEKYLGDKLDER